MSMLFRMYQPEALVEEVVAALPERLFTSSTTTFCDPAMGKGDYLIGVAKRLLKYGHTRDNILSRLHGYEMSHMYTNMCIYRTPISGANIEVMTYDEVLAGGIKMKFDCVVGNPPYQSSTNTTSIGQQTVGIDLYKQFYNDIFSTATCGVVLSARWDRGFHNNVVNDTHVTTIGYATNHFASTTKGIEMVYVIRDDNSSSDTIEVVLKSTKTRNIMRGDYSIALLKRCDSPLIDSILSKTVASRGLDTLWVSYNNKTHGPGTTMIGQTGTDRIVKTVGARNKPTVDGRITPQFTQPHMNKWKLIFGKSGQPHKLGTTKILEPNVLVSGQVQFLVFDTEVEARNAQSIINSSLYLFITKMVKSNIENNKAFWKHLPVVDFSRPWTDNELTDYFELTDNEKLYLCS